jgi:hypothetical protein
LSLHLIHHKLVDGQKHSKEAEDRSALPYYHQVLVSYGMALQQLNDLVWISPQAKQSVARIKALTSSGTQAPR